VVNKTQMVQEYLQSHWKVMSDVAQLELMIISWFVPKNMTELPVAHG